MKNISILFISIFIVGLFSCQNEKWEFDDFDYSTVYFPYQYPVRTLVLGDYETGDNTNDNNLKFVVSAAIGGMYENKENRTVNYELAPALVQNVRTTTSDTLTILPSNYYTLTPLNQILIPKGKFTGGVEVQLTEDFLNDPRAHTRRYVLPLRITSSSLDSVLSGKPGTDNPDPRVAAHWDIVPKNFTLFGIKYINAYHGKYLHRGQSVIKDAANVTLQTNVYRKPYVEQDEIWALTTVGRNTVSVTGVIRQTPASPGNFTMNLTFDDNGNCTIVNDPESAFAVTGSGKFLKNADSWGNKPRNAIYINYQITVGSETHFATDTLVIRDRDVRFEVFTPVIY